MEQLQSDDRHNEIAQSRNDIMICSHILSMQTNNPRQSITQSLVIITCKITWLHIQSDPTRLMFQLQDHPASHSLPCHAGSHTPSPFTWSSNFVYTWLSCLMELLNLVSKYSINNTASDLQHCISVKSVQRVILKQQDDQSAYNRHTTDGCKITPFCSISSTYYYWEGAVRTNVQDLCRMPPLLVVGDEICHFLHFC